MPVSWLVSEMTTPGEQRAAFVAGFDEEGRGRGLRRRERGSASTRAPARQEEPPDRAVVAGA